MSDQLLNLKRSHGIVTGDPNIKYIQDGKRYDHRGVLIPEKADGAPPEPETNPPSEPNKETEEDQKAQVRRNKEAVMKAWTARHKKQG